MRPIVPAKDFDISGRFYVDLGFEPERLTERLVEMHLGAYSFILQNYYVETWADNFVMHMRVSDVRLWWDHIVGLDLVRRYRVETKAPQLEEWGLVAALTDPSGVLWRFAEIPAQNSLKRGARTGAYLRPCISRISSTGQTGAVVPVHCATVFASKRSSLRRSLIFARISSR